jgi:hypothetical protein
VLYKVCLKITARFTTQKIFVNSTIKPTLGDRGKDRGAAAQIKLLV